MLLRRTIVIIGAAIILLLLLYPPFCSCGQFLCGDKNYFVGHLPLSPMSGDSDDSPVYDAPLLGLEVFGTILATSLCYFVLYYPIKELPKPVLVMGAIVEGVVILGLSDQNSIFQLAYWELIDMVAVFLCAVNAITLAIWRKEKRSRLG